MSVSRKQRRAQGVAVPEPTSVEEPVAVEAAAHDLMAEAMAHFGLEPRHILASRLRENAAGQLEAAILTNGGRRVIYPQDSGRVLSPADKGEVPPKAEPAGIFGKRA